MTKIEQAVKIVSDLYDFYTRIEKARIFLKSKLQRETRPPNEPEPASSISQESVEQKSQKSV